MAYTTIDDLPDLTYSEMGAARSLSFGSYPVPSIGWDNRADVHGNENYAILHDTYRFTAIAGATYDIYSTSFLDPFLLRIFDQNGNTIVANDESDDGADIYLGDGYYGQDVISNWVAPYSGTFYVAANWNQGAYYTYYDLSLYEDVDTALAVDISPPYPLTFSPSDGAMDIAIGANIVLTFSEAIQRGTGSIVLKTAGGTVVATYDAATSPNLNISGSTLTINPSHDLDIFTTYKVEFTSAAIKDLAGNAYSGSIQDSFTTQTIDGLYHFFVVAFNAAPGVEYMNQLADAYNYGLTLKEIVNIFTTKTQFTSVYPESLSDEQLATQLVSNIVKNSASEQSKAEAVHDIEGALAIGWSRGDVIFQVFGNLAAKPLSDAT